MIPLPPLALLFFVFGELRHGFQVSEMVFISPLSGSNVVADVTIYRAKANLPTQGANVNVSAIGTASGQDGGTTYIEEKLISSVNVAYSSPPITSLITNVRTETGSYSVT
jgi:hypothetical protein